MRVHVGRTFRFDMKIQLAETSTIEGSIVDDAHTQLAHWVNSKQDEWEDQISYGMEDIGDRLYQMHLWLQVGVSRDDAESSVVAWLADLQTRSQGIEVTMVQKEEEPEDPQKECWKVPMWCWVRVKQVSEVILPADDAEEARSLVQDEDEEDWDWEDYNVSGSESVQIGEILPTEEEPTWTP